MVRIGSMFKQVHVESDEMPKPKGHAAWREVH